MIHVEFYRDTKNGSVQMEMQGHAETAPKGQDLVCAAATTVAYTLAQAVQFLYEQDRLLEKPVIQIQMRACIQALERIKGSSAAPAAPAAPVAPKPASFSAPAAPVAPAATSGSVADEIAHNVEALVGTTEEPAPKAEPKHPVNDTTTSRFANLNLQFGRNYDPTHK